jgi:hypothetical protein
MHGNMSMDYNVDKKKSHGTPTSSLPKLGSRRSSKSKKSTYRGSRASRASKFERSSFKG